MSSGSGNISSVIQFGGVAINSNIAYGTCPQINIPTSLLSSVVTLMGGVFTSSVAADFYGFYSASSPTTQAQYQVPSGKTFYCMGIYYAAGATNLALQLGYGTAALGSEGTATPPTGVIYYGSNNGSGGAAVQTSPLISTVAGPAYSYFAVPVSFPAGAYPFWRISSSSQSYEVTMIGIVQ